MALYPHSGILLFAAIYMKNGGFESSKPPPELKDMGNQSAQQRFFLLLGRSYFYSSVYNLRFIRVSIFRAGNVST